MATTTEFLGLTLPAGTDAVDIAQINGNFKKLETQAKATENTVKANHAACTAYTAPMQDASVEGAYMLMAEYTFPKNMNYESADITLLIRNRGVQTSPKDGILRVRLRYGKAAAVFQYAQIYWLTAIGMDATKFLLVYNDSTATARLYVSESAAYGGYICKVLDMGTSSSIVDFTSWNLYSPTTGDTELPAEDEGWTVVTSTGV